MSREYHLRYLEQVRALKGATYSSDPRDFIQSGKLDLRHQEQLRALKGTHLLVEAPRRKRWWCVTKRGKVRPSGTSHVYEVCVGPGTRVSRMRNARSGRESPRGGRASSNSRNDREKLSRALA